jgi:hypothetical protein
MMQFLWGALTMAGWVAGLFFLQYWRATRDRLFAFFAVAFWLLALSWMVLGAFEIQTETRHYVYVIRLLAFLVLIVGILDKNRRTRSS